MDEQILNAIFALVLLSFVVERSLAVVFELPFIDRYIRIVPNPENPRRPRSIKGYIAAAVSIAICTTAGFNLLGPIFTAAGDTVSDPRALSGAVGAILTGLVVAGGSQASVKLFQDVLGVSRLQRDYVQRLKEEQNAAEMAEATSRIKQFSMDGLRMPFGAQFGFSQDRFGLAMRRTGEADANRRVDAAAQLLNADDEKGAAAAYLRERLRATRKAREATLRQG